MAWIRDGAPPEQIKVSFIVSTKEFPELAQFILSLPYRGTSKILREVLSSAVKSAGAGSTVMNGPALQSGVDRGVERSISAQGDGADQRAVSGVAPGIDEVSSAAAGIIENFDKMFPS